MAEVSILAVNEIAESIGISKLDLSIKRTVSREAEMVILNVIDTAKLQMLMSKREKLKASDINETLGVMKMNKLYGYSNKKTNTEEINLKYTTLHYSPFLDLLFPDEQQIQISEIANRGMKEYPISVTFDCKWLSNKKKRSWELDQEQTFQKTQELDNSDASNFKDINISINLPSKKLKFYFDTSLEGFSCGGVVYEMMLARMVHDEGVGPLLIYYLEFIENIIKVDDDEHHNFRVIRKLIKLLKILVINDSFNSGRYPDQIVSIAFTILLLPTKGTPFDNNNILMRRECGELFQIICEKFSVFNVQIYAQIAEQFIELLNSQTIDCYVAYAIILAFKHLGAQAIKYILYPNVEMILKNIQKETFYNGPEKHLVYDALIDVIGNGLYRDLYLQYFYRHIQINSSTQEAYDQLIGTLGLDITRFNYEEEEMLFI